MRGVILCLALLFWRQAWVSSKSHRCDFTKEKYLLSDKNEVYCEIEAKPFDDITFICPNKTGALCFDTVNTSKSTDEHKMNSSKMSIQDILYGSVVYGNTLLVSPYVKSNISFYCFCNLDIVTIQKFLKVNRYLKDDDELHEADMMKHLKGGNVSKEKYDEYLNKALNRLKKMKDLSNFYNNESQNKPELKLPDFLKIPQYILSNDTYKNAARGSNNGDNFIVDDVTQKKIISKYGIMKVFVHNNNNVIKGCDFGTNSYNYFSQQFPSQDNVNNKVCKLQAKPGELVGFKCAFDGKDTIEPANCFDKVLYENKETDLKTLIPGYISFKNKHSSKYPYYLKIPHYVKQQYTIQCKCKSSKSYYDYYTFELDIQPGESEVLNKSFNSS
ncbi:6-cysteine protein [Plasmodium sp. gorilla clade G2]|uniref:6-cysteine protein n=1 Tax=Plasmodium sp. gorilla clade G2 TaxID=880535 RepID=UPI000D2105AB|nr:6-cysteine protein [Plasmodium sp. gorilla clade G2]SOV11179.1 6-cysteine protein [Plasmodium sp. gorilla clade G2]